MFELLKKYLSPFVVLKDVTLDIMTVMADVINHFYTIMLTLQTSIYEGKALRILLDDLKIFYLANNTDSELLEKLKNQERILTQRGTRQGIYEDLQCLDEVGTFEIKGKGEAGEIVADINPIDSHACCLDLHKIIVIYSQEGDVFNETTKEIIKKYIVPIEIKPIFVER